jgi:DNA modification methylase
MRILKRELIEVRNRQRRDRPASAVADKKTSILSKGLFHPPVVYDEGGGSFVLCAGETRLLAIDSIAKEGGFFMCDGKPITPGEVPVTLITDLSAVELMEAEFEENELRDPLTWQDRAEALAKIHELRQASNPKQTFISTARQLLEKGSGKSSVAPNRLATTIRQSVVIRDNLHKVSVKKARTAEEALQIILKDEGAALESELIRRRLNVTPPSSQLISVRHGDLTLILPMLDAGQFDLIIADPPYGIKADSAGFRGRTVHHHNYSDTPELAKDILRVIITEGFRVTQNRANLFIFGDIDLFPTFKDSASRLGWTPFRTPITWVKSWTEGLAPWGEAGPRRTTEWIFYATKGQRGLHQSPPDILDFRRVPRHERVYGAEKPLDLMKQLIEVGSMPGDFILDPCCGAGSTLAAARSLKRRALGIEIDEAAYNLALVRAQGKEEEAVGDIEELV